MTFFFWVLQIPASISNCHLAHVPQAERQRLESEIKGIIHNMSLTN